MDSQAEKLCFVIGRVGEEGSDIRRRADEVFNYIIKKAAVECGYQAIRSNQIAKPGMITDDIMRHLCEDPLAIADLTDHNPNVFYELAIRHIVEKPVINIIQEPQRPPFDLGGFRTIFFTLTPRGAEDAVNEIKKAIQEVEEESKRKDFWLRSPISSAVDNIKGKTRIIEGEAKLKEAYVKMRFEDAVQIQATWCARYSNVRGYFEEERAYFSRQPDLHIERLINPDAIEPTALREFRAVVDEIWQTVPKGKERYQVYTMDVSEFDFYLTKYVRGGETKLKALFVFNDPLSRTPKLGISIDPEITIEYMPISYSIQSLFARLKKDPWKPEASK